MAKADGSQGVAAVPGLHQFLSPIHRNYSSIAPPLNLTLVDVSRVSWGQEAEDTNQSLENTLCSLASANTSWSQYLTWSGICAQHLAQCVLSPFVAQFGYQPPLFPEQERDAGVLSPTICYFIRHCRATWRRA